MNVEIERKFLVKNDGWKRFADDGQKLCQGYLHSDKSSTIRIRIQADRGYLTIKGKTVGCTRPEFEYEIPKADAEDLLKLCNGCIIEKHRYLVRHDGMVWEVDVFNGKNSGLILAEIELQSEDQSFTTPEWLGQEVTHDARYCNACLANTPFNDWQG